MIDHLFDLYRGVARRFVLVVNPSAEVSVKAHCDAVAPNLGVEYVRQSEPTGMLDAILLAADAARRSHPDRVWITWCDQVGVHPDTIATLQRLSTEQPDASIVLPTARQENPYIHFERDEEGRIIGVSQRREGDAMPSVGESDMGLFSLSPDSYFQWLPRFGLEATRASATRERNFLPFVPWLAKKGHRLYTFPCTDDVEAIGVNTPDDRRRLERYLLERDRS
jgi:bifunctional N-acetylglucosamine-1-phosphate-uridyltransferase/glucosamine-1-phosphate-acetyltransferase GlmU-like protein